jgi:hypothetical protein
VITLEGLTKRYGETTAVDALDLTVERVGDLAHQLGIRLRELRTQQASLEEAYLELTADSVQYGVAVAS